MSKYSSELKISACKDYPEGRLSRREIYDKYGITRDKGFSMLYIWLNKYQSIGEKAFMKHNGNRSYSVQEKQTAVEEYLTGQGSLQDICIKYRISSKETLHRWVLLYNDNRELKDYNPKLLIVKTYVTL